MGLRVIVLSGFWFGLFAGFVACRCSVCMSFAVSVVDELWIGML